MLTPFYENRFEKEVERARKRGKDMKKLSHVINMLIDEKALPAKYKNHKLVGEYKGFHECHVEPDWLLIYRVTKTMIFFTRTGSHSDLF